MLRFASGRLPSQATRFATGAIAGATLMPMVINAHTIAAKTEAIWVREERVILYSFQVGLN
jgi:hypothetical protein